MQRFCQPRTIYWRAFVEVSAEHRFSHAIPLVRPDPKSDSHGLVCMGVIVIEGPERAAVGFHDAVFLYYLCYAASCLLVKDVATGEYRLLRS